MRAACRSSPEGLTARLTCPRRLSLESQPRDHTPIGPSAALQLLCEERADEQALLLAGRQLDGFFMVCDMPALLMALPRQWLLQAKA
eukprot:203940-Chlamydomonas_euryale.AAC.3